MAAFAAHSSASERRLHRAVQCAEVVRGGGFLRTAERMPRALLAAGSTGYAPSPFRGLPASHPICPDLTGIVSRGWHVIDQLDARPKRRWVKSKLDGRLSRYAVTH